MCLTCCAPADRDFGVTIESVELRRNTGDAVLAVRQRVRLSDEARQALVHGVPLVFRVEGRVSPAGRGGERIHVVQDFELSYLPLSDHYRLAVAEGGPGAPVRTYPRLRHALAGFAEVTLRLPADFPDEHGVRVRVRSHIAERELPPPMRLPAWLSARWHHDSGWLERTVSLPERT